MRIIIRPIIFSLVFIIAGSFPCYAKGKGNDKKTEKTVKKNAGIVTVNGKVRLVGNDPFTEIVITNDEGDWYITETDKELLFELQQQRVTVSGEVYYVGIILANGSNAGIKRTLKNVRIIK